jgi:hypothetical protein
VRSASVTSKRIGYQRVGGVVGKEACTVQTKSISQLDLLSPYIGNVSALLSTSKLVMQGKRTFVLY